MGGYQYGGYQPQQMPKVMNNLTEDEIRELDEKYPNHLNGRLKCRDCIWLSDEKTVIGRKCVCPDKKFNSKTAMWKPGSTPACKNFERKVEQTDETNS